jgi:UDP-glucose 4-epimerase
LAGQRVVVTGGAGFIGSWVVRQLLQEQCQVKVLDDFSTGRVENLPRGLGGRDVVHCDINVDCSDIIRDWRPDVVVHLAGQISVAQSALTPHLDAATNIVGTLRLIEACERAGVARLVFAASCAIYGEPGVLPVTELAPIAPLNPYGLSKATAVSYLEWAARTYDLECVSLVFGNVYGPGQSVAHGGVVAKLIDAGLHGRPLEVVGDGEQTRDFLFVDDAARALVLACTRGRSGMINVGSGRQVSVNEVARLIADRMELPEDRIRHEPLAPSGVGRMVLDVSKARSELQWWPMRSLVDGINHAVSYESHWSRQRLVEYPSPALG